jgi:hypothetical protein
LKVHVQSGSWYRREIEAKGADAISNHQFLALESAAGRRQLPISHPVGWGRKEGDGKLAYPSIIPRVLGNLRCMNQQVKSKRDAVDDSPAKEARRASRKRLVKKKG